MSGLPQEPGRPHTGQPHHDVVEPGARYVTPQHLSGTDPAPDERSIGEIVGDLSRNFTQLMRQEVALAKAELQQSASRAGKGAGMLTGAGLAGYLALLFASLAAWWAIGVAIGTAERPSLGWSGVIVAVVWAIVAAILAATGKSQLKNVEGLPQTTETVSRIPQALKGEEENR